MKGKRCGFVLVNALVTTILLGCAREGLPPGGPRDVFPPYVVESEPPSGSTEVALDVEPALVFNERINDRSIDGNIFIAPIVEFETETNWRGNRIKVKFTESIRDDRTYIITAGTGIRDLRGNRMDSTYVYAFSTGANIDQGQITGFTLQNDRPASDVYVWAFSLTDDPMPDPTQASPEYLIQSGAQGAFQFTHLSADRYRLFAFLDSNRNRRYDPSTDPIGVPSGDISLSDESMEAGPLFFRLSVQDTASLHIDSARSIHNRAVVVRMNEKPMKLQADATESGAPETRAPGFFTIRGLEDEDLLEVHSAYTNPDDSTAIVLVTDLQTSDKEYRLTIAGLENNRGEPMDTTRNTITFKGSSFEDSSPPQLLTIAPNEGDSTVALSAGVTLSFNEPVMIGDQSLSVVDSTGLSVQGRLEWVSLTTAVLNLNTLLLPNAAYNIRILTGSIVDGAGGFLEFAGESPDTITIAFSTLHPEELGSLQGRIEDEQRTATGPLWISLIHAEDDRRQQQKLEGEERFRFDEVLPGRYLLHVQRDENANDRFDPGTAIPFLPAERYEIHPDTIEVRSGWETEDIVIRMQGVRR